MKSLKETDANRLGVKIIISGKNKLEKFVTYCIDTKNNFKETAYENIPLNGFSVAYAASNYNLVTPIVQKHIYATTPWGDIDNLKKHMQDCIKEVSTVDNTVNDNIHGVMIL